MGDFLFLMYFWGFSPGISSMFLKWKLSMKYKCIVEEPQWQLKVGRSDPQPFVTGRASCQYLYSIGKHGFRWFLVAPWLGCLYVGFMPDPVLIAQPIPQRIILASMPHGLKPSAFVCRCLLLCHGDMRAKNSFRRVFALQTGGPELDS